MSDGDKVFVDKMVSLFMELTPELMNRLNLAIESMDYKEIKLTAHKMISSIDMMGIDSLKQIVRSLEAMASQKADMAEIKLSADFLEKTLLTVMDQIRGSN